MKVHTLYKQVWDKATEVSEVINGLARLLDQYAASRFTYTAEKVLENPEGLSACAFDYDCRTDTRRHVKLLYADYCTLRDELIKLLQTDVSVASQVKPLKVELELPDDYPRSAKVQGSEMDVCISVTDRAAQK